jgi:TatD DNase family protein
MEFVDTHCHLHFQAFDSDRAEVLAVARAAGVAKIICVGTTLADSQAAADYAAGQPEVYAAAGVHPHEAEVFLEDGRSASRLRELLKMPKMVAVGEIGLDYYKNYSPREIQQKALRAQIETGLATGLPFIFHVRDAWSDFWPIFDDYRGLVGVVHSFSSGVKQLDAALQRGLYIGLNGIMTFTKDQAQLDAAKQVPLDKLVLETDAPFLAPVPFRGQTGQPKHVANTAEFLAELRGQTVEEIAQATTENAVRLFDLK